jgi:nucleoside-diphosphate-sugar epimerase
VLGVVNPTIRELDEMLYEFTQPFVVDGSKATRRLGIEPTPMDDAIAQTVAWFRGPPPARRPEPEGR